MAVSERHIMNRLYMVTISLLVFAVAIVVKLVRIQWEEGEHYKEFAEQRTVKEDIIVPNRGNIYADDGSLLATSVSKFDIRFDAMTVSKRNWDRYLSPLCDSLGTMMGRSASYYQNTLNKARANKSRYHLLARNIDYDQYLRIKSFPLFKLGSNKGGFIAEQRTVREHPVGKIAERTIGYDRKDSEGYYSRAGLEGAFGRYLAGKEGYQMKQLVGKGQWKSINDAHEKEPQDGYDIITTINLNIQDIAHHSLLEQLEAYEADHGCVVVMETKTGAVKAIANLGKSPKGKYYERRNYAVWESHEPGSTFKLMAMVTALEDKVIDTSYVVDTEKGVLTFYKRFKVRDSRRGGYGKITASKAFVVSSNTGMVKIVNEHYKDRPERFVERLYNMGLDKPLGLPISGETPPKIPHPDDKENWDGLDLPWMAYGYGVSFTPLQTLAFYNAVANDGEMVKPRFIEEIREFNKPIQHFDKEVINRSICSKTTLRKVQKMLQQVVEDKDGTGHKIYSPRYSMAGKTGTCQVDYHKEEVQYISSFVGYFPAEDPKYSCIVVIHRPNKKKGYYGADVAAPVFRRIAQKIYTDTPITDEIRSLGPLEETLAQRYETYYKQVENATNAEKMPNVKGMPVMDAVPLLENLGVRVRYEGTGIVKEQSLSAGTPLKKNQIVVLKLS